MAVDITLHKEKYRVKKPGDKNGSYKGRTGNSHQPKKKGLSRPNPRRYTNGPLYRRDVPHSGDLPELSPEHSTDAGLTSAGTK